MRTIVFLRDVPFIYWLGKTELPESYCHDKSLCSCYDHFLKVPKRRKVKLWDVLHIFLLTQQRFVAPAVGTVLGAGSVGCMLSSRPHGSPPPCRWA